MIDLHDSTDPEITVAATVLANLDTIAALGGVDYLVVGATARTILSVALVGRAPDRATRDIDIAVAVGSWDDFERLTRHLPRHGRSQHSFSVVGVDVDVVPYGGIEEADRTILWPDEHRMNVRGLREAFDNAETVLLPDGVIARVPSLPALAVLKLLTWADRRLLTTRDAIDLDTIMRWCTTGKYLDQLYGEEIDVLISHDFDPGLASSWLLGSRMARILDPAGAAAVLDVLDDDGIARLANDMNRPFAHTRERLYALRDGTRAGTKHL